MLTPRMIRELLRRTEQAQQLLDVGATGASYVQPLNDAREHLEHVRLTLVGAITSAEQLAGRSIDNIR